MPTAVVVVSEPAAVEPGPRVASVLAVPHAVDISRFTDHTGVEPVTRPVNVVAVR